MSGPDTASKLPSSMRVTHGASEPYSKRRNKLVTHCDAAAAADDDANHIRGCPAWRHEVYQGDSTIRGFEICLQNKRIVAVVSGNTCSLVRRRNQPPAVLPSTEERREACGAVKTRPAKPVDGSITSNESGSFAISQK